MSASGAHNPPKFKHAEDMEWEMGAIWQCHQIPLSPATGTLDRAQCGLSQDARRAHPFPMDRRLSRGRSGTSSRASSRLLDSSMALV